MNRPVHSILPALRDALSGRYRVERELARGAMATVFLAEAPDGRSRVAVKVLHPEMAAALGPQRFHREIEILARLRHPCIVPILDSGAAGSLLYLVMPYVSGENLRVRLSREGQLPLAAVLSIMGDLASGMDYAHHENVVHRDIKPENVLLRGDRALICDFGLARAIDRAAMDSLSSSGLVIGTPGYMSPEQAGGAEPPGPASDVYALGCVVYEMLTGELPFSGPTPQAVIARHRLEPPRPMRTVRPGLPDHVEAAVLAALAKAPSDRPASAAAFVAALAG